MSRQDRRGLEDIITGGTTNGFQTPESKPTDVEDEPKQRRYPSREGKTPVQFFLNEDAHRQLKITAAETGKTNQDILIEALNAWFLMNDKPPIA